VVALVAVLAGGLVYAFAGGGKSETTLNHVAYARLWTKTTRGTPVATVLGSWPAPYQTYHDGFQNMCYEWWDSPVRLYNLCFKKGVLVTKSFA
jgi:hypothetical protein